jgi:hypothetical protein
MKRANRDLLFEQRSGLRGRKPTRSRLAAGAQHALGGRGTHREQSASALLGQVQMPMPLQVCDKRGQIRDQTFGTDIFGRFLVLQL